LAFVQSGQFVAITCFAVIALLAAWEFSTRRMTDNLQEGNYRRGQVLVSWHALRRLLATLILPLSLLSIVAFFLPLTYGFWQGYDDPLMLSTARLDWMFYDQMYNRPFVPLGPLIGLRLSPDTIDGFVWLAVLLRIATAVALYAILRQFDRLPKYIPLLAALLFIVNPSEPGRFLAVSLDVYQFSVFLMALAVAVYLFSYKAESRALLVGALLLFAIVLLSNEAGYLLALAVPALLWIAIKDRRHWLIWAYAWWGVIVVLAARLIIFLVTTPNNYQLETTGAPVTSGGQLIRNVWTQIQPLVAFGEVTAGEQTFLGYGVAAATVASLALWVVAGRQTESSSRRVLLSSIGIAAVACLLAVVPYFKFPYVLRTQFFAAPAQAAFWALVIGLVVSFLGFAARRIVLALTGGLLVLIATTGAMFTQNDSVNRGTSVNFAKLVYVYQQVHDQAPQLAPGTLVLFVADNFSSMPFRANYDVNELTQLVLNASGIVTAADPLGWQPSFSNNGVEFGNGDIFATKYEYRYSEVVAFRLAPNGDIKLLSAFPDALLPNGVVADGYDPGSRIEQGGEPLRFLRSYGWMRPYDPKLAAMADIVDPDADLRLGAGWYGFERYNGQSFRWVNNDAELVVGGTDASEEQVNLRLEAAPRTDGQPLKLDVLDSDDGHQVAQYDVAGASTISIMVPAVNSSFRYRLHVENSSTPNGPDPRTLNFRVFEVSQAIPPSQLGAFPSDLDALGSQHSGLYTDGWVSQDAYVELNKAPNAAIFVRGIVPLIDDAGFSTEMQVLVDGREVGSQILHLGEFEVSIPAPGAAGERKLELRFSRTQQLPDGRPVGALLHGIGFQTDATATP
jgi:hypothetical protein